MIPSSQLNRSLHYKPGSQLNITIQIHKRFTTEHNNPGSQFNRLRHNKPGSQQLSRIITIQKHLHGFKAQILQLMCSANFSDFSQHLEQEQLELVSAFSWLGSSSFGVSFSFWVTFSSWGASSWGGLLFLLRWPSNIFINLPLSTNNTRKCV